MKSVGIEWSLRIDRSLCVLLASMEMLYEPETSGTIFLRESDMRVRSLAPIHHLVNASLAPIRHGDSFGGELGGGAEGEVCGRVGGQHQPSA